MYRPGILDWLVNEQLEEVSKMSTVLSVIQRADDNTLLAQQYVKDTPADIEASKAIQARDDLGL